MNVLSLFAGIGGLDLGLSWAGFTTVGWCERDPFCRRVMEHHWPGLWNHDDITTLDPDDAVRGCGRIDLICGGFPCQPVSTAGKRRGTADARWLWPDMARVIRGVRPAWVLAENVPGLRSLGADDVLDDLEAAGYACWPVVVGAGDVGAPHRRKRVFIVGHRDSGMRRRQGPKLNRGAAAAARLAGECLRMAHSNVPRPSLDASQRGDSRAEREAAVGSGGTVEHAEGIERGQGRQPAGERPGGLVRPDSFRWPMPPGPEQHEWEPPRLVEPRLGLCAPGLPTRLAGRARRERLRALGNAVVPQVAYVLGLAIQRLEQAKGGGA